MNAVLALDIGGTKIAAGVVAEDGTVLSSSLAVTTPGGSATQLWDATCEALDAARAGYGGEIDGVGIGCGGPMQWPQGLISPLNIPGWRDFPLLDRVRERYAPGGEVRIHNDAICFALGESRYGASRGHPTSVGMVVSTGVGGGIIIDGNAVDGVSGNAGHIGHVVVDPDGPACACGGRGCLEAIASGPSLTAWAVSQGWRPHESGAEPTARAVGSAAREGDPIAIAALRRAGEAVGVAVASVAALLDVRIVVVGGGVAQTGDLLLGPARSAYARYAGLDFIRDLQIVPNALGQQAGLIGAAALLMND